MESDVNNQTTAAFSENRSELSSSVAPHRRRPAALVIGVFLTAFTLTYLHLKTTPIEAHEVDSQTSSANAVKQGQKRSAPAKASSPKAKDLGLKEHLRKAVSLAQEMEANPFEQDQLESTLRRQVREFKPSDTAELKRVTLDSDVTLAQRKAALAVLRTMGKSAYPALAQFAATALPTSDTSRIDDERELRMLALEVLDEAAVDGADVTNLLDSVTSKQKDRVLVFLADTSLNSIAQGRPGKLGRMIAQMMDKKSVK